MKILELTVESTGPGECSINGVNAADGRAGAVFDEKIFLKSLSPMYQWFVLCEARKLTARMASAYDDGRLARGETLLEPQAKK